MTKTTKAASPVTGGKTLADELDGLAETLNRYGYVLFSETTQEEKEWIDNAFSKVAIRLKEIAKAARRSDGSRSDAVERLRIVESARADLHWLYLDHLRTHLGPHDQRLVRKILAKLSKATIAVDVNSKEDSK
jgi:hypothetical protein